MYAAHQAGIVHRDLKPGNVLLQNIPSAQAEKHKSLEDGSSLGMDGHQTLTDRFTPKLADFGLAKDLSLKSLTLTDELLGSLPYMAPEQLGDSNSNHAAVDIHALGVILYECLTGRSPFADATPATTIQRIISQDAVSPRRYNPSIPVNLSAVCDRCLEKDPTHRYTSALDLADDLRRFCDREPTHARMPGVAWRLLRGGEETHCKWRSC